MKESKSALSNNLESLPLECTSAGFIFLIAMGIVSKDFFALNKFNPKGEI